MPTSLPEVGHNLGPRYTDRGSAADPLVRISVNLNSRASRALREAADMTGHSKTDCVNRALQIYEFVEKVLADGGNIYVRQPGKTEIEVVKLF
jgi:hypothetical protein